MKLQIEAGAVKEEVKNHFEKRFLKTEVVTPNIERLEFKKLSQEKSRKIEEGFSKEEIEDVVFKNDGIGAQTLMGLIWSS